MLDVAKVNEFLLERGAGRLPHPGGTLFEHLERVAALLATWGADEALQSAGLCHACYGTDGYDAALVRPLDRTHVVELIGTSAESLVYLYGSCDRRATYPQLGRPGPVPFRDRFTGEQVYPSEWSMRAFVELTAANELDVIRNNQDMARLHGADLLRLFTRAREYLSDAAWRSCAEFLVP